MPLLAIAIASTSPHGVKSPLLPDRTPMNGAGECGIEGCVEGCEMEVRGRQALKLTPMQQPLTFPWLTEPRRDRPPNAPLPGRRNRDCNAPPLTIAPDKEVRGTPPRPIPLDSKGDLENFKYLGCGQTVSQVFSTLSLSIRNRSTITSSSPILSTHSTGRSPRTPRPSRRPPRSAAARSRGVSP